MDSLACLTILLRLYIENGDYRFAWKVAKSLFSVLTMLGHHFGERKISDRLFKVYSQRIFCKVAWDGRRFHIDNYDYLKSAYILHYAALHPRPMIEKMPEGWGLMRLKWEALNKWGPFFPLVLEPLIGPDLDVGPPTHELLLSYANVVELKKIALKYLFGLQADSVISALPDAMENEEHAARWCA